MTVTYSIGTLSERSGVNIETIRYYEKVGLLPAASRASNGYRQYDDASVERLAFVRAGANSASPSMKSANCSRSRITRINLARMRIV